jgi:hypothetical protein
MPGGVGKKSWVKSNVNALTWSLVEIKGDPGFRDDAGAEYRRSPLNFKPGLTIRLSRVWLRTESPPMQVYQFSSSLPSRGSRLKAWRSTYSAT